jgi:hypothetical protein
MIFARQSLSTLTLLPKRQAAVVAWFGGVVVGGGSQTKTMATVAWRRGGGRKVSKSQRRPLYDRVITPSLDIANSMPLSCREMDNSSLLTLTAMKNHDACVEALKRHIMSVDKVSYQVAEQTFFDIAAMNSRGIEYETIPYKVAIAAALTAGFSSIPLCFHLPSVHWFNETFVTTDIPEPADLETWLEVGAWSWNWMEPPLGQISFLLLCLQSCRSQLDNLGIRPYTSAVKQRRAKTLAAAFPLYNTKLVMDFSKTAGFYKHKY